MAKHTREYFTCDRCGREIEKPYYGGESGTHEMSFHVGYAVAGEKQNWRELCHGCDSYLGDIIYRLKQDQKVAREAAKARET